MMLEEQIREGLIARGERRFEAGNMVIYLTLRNKVGVYFR